MGHISVGKNHEEASFIRSKFKADVRLELSGLQCDIISLMMIFFKVQPLWMHVDVWQNQYNIVKQKNKK